MKCNRLLLCTILCPSLIQLCATSNIDRAKILVRGAKMYREQTLPRLYEFLEIAGLGRSAKKLKDNIALIEQCKNDIETNLETTLNAAELDLRTTNKSALERQQIFMIAKVIDEINKLFNTLDNIMSNLEKPVRDYRKEQKKLEPAYETIKQELAKLQEDSKKIAEKIQGLKKQAEPQLKVLGLNPASDAYDKALVKKVPGITVLRNQFEQLKAKITQKENVKKVLEKEFVPTLQEYYEKMEQDSKGLFNLAKSLGLSMTEKAGTEQSLVEQYTKTLEDQKTKFADAKLLKQLDDATKDYDIIMGDIQKEIAGLSESEQRLWGILTDLYQRVLLTESIILYGSTPMQQWTLPKILGIKLPETVK